MSVRKQVWSLSNRASAGGDENVTDRVDSTSRYTICVVRKLKEIDSTLDVDTAAAAIDGTSRCREHLWGYARLIRLAIHCDAFT
jgi:hypothetical protein